ncbi:MAG: hypothetical protein J3R72DRAFT_11400 [Linnemannia gamsii]|nr:MAG: hypothetical protein J3R72DRAFT_507232 [Linnemannia gamsii]KAK3827003.1 MAG: hypothetical protein J3R72DRAFT_11400 [Linnemannia gamsii]
MNDNFSSSLKRHSSSQQPASSSSSSSNLYLASPTPSHSSPVLAPLPSRTSALSAIPFSDSSSHQLVQDADLAYSLSLSPGLSALHQQQSPQQQHFHHYRQAHQYQQQYQQYQQQQTQQQQQQQVQLERQANELQFLRQQLLDKGGQQALHQKRPIAPLPIAGMASSSTQLANRKRGAPVSQLSNSTTGGVNKKRRTAGKADKGKAINNNIQQPADDTKFWKKPGMKIFLAWLLDPNNQQRLRNAGTTSGVMKKDLYHEIADVVNAQSTDQSHAEWQPWLERHVKYNITASEQKYRRAKQMWTETGAGDDDKSVLRSRVLKTCPLFDKFDRIYSSNPRVNPPRMVQTTEVPGEPAELLDDSEEEGGSGEGEGDEGAGSGEGDEEEGDESDEGGEDMMELEDHRHLQVEGFDMALLLADDDDDAINNTPSRDSTSSVVRIEPSTFSSIKNQQAKKRVSKGKSKDTSYPQQEAIFQKLAGLSSTNGASSGLLADMRKEVAERERECLKRELDWVSHGLHRMEEFNRNLEERRKEHEQELQQARAALEKEKIEWTLFKNEELAKLNRLKESHRQESLSQTPSVTFLNIVNNSPSPPASAPS